MKLAHGNPGLSGSGYGSSHSDCPMEKDIPGQMRIKDTLKFRKKTKSGGKAVFLPIPFNKVQVLIIFEKYE